MLRFHGSAAKKEFLYVGYNSRLDAMQAAFLRIFLRHLDEWNQQRREAAARYTELLAGLVETPVDEPGHVYHMYCVRSPERDRLADALQGGRHRLRRLLPAAAAPAAGSALSRLLRGRLPRDRAGVARESLPAAVGRDHRGAAGGGRLRPQARFRSRSRPDALPGQSTPGLAACVRCGPDRRRVAADVLPALRQDDADLLPAPARLAGVALVVAINLSTFVLFGFYNRWWRYVSTRDMWGAFRGVTVASVITYLVLYAFPPAHTSRLPRGVAALDYPAAARLRRRHAPARAHADRAAAGRPRRARQGGADRRRRRRRPADGARAAAQPAAALHADRLRRRRPAQARRPHQRREGARHDRRPAAPPARQQAGRGADRDPVGAGARAPEDRRDVPRRAGRRSRRCRGCTS